MHYMHFNLHMNQQIINTISSLLIKSPKTDQELSDMIGVSRVMIHKWKKCQVKKIRKSNLVSIAKAVNHELKILIDGSIELIPIDNQIETNENAVDSKDLVLKALDTSTMHNKWLQIELEEYKQKILNLEKQNIKLKENDSAFSGYIKIRARNGTITAMKSFDGGYPDGDFFEWYENGKLKTKSQYKMGEKHGYFYIWTKKGDVYSQRYFQNDLVNSDPGQLLLNFDCL